MRKILSRLFWILIILLMCLWSFEFYRVRNGKNPKFTFKVEEHIYEDGITKIYYGVGYKVFDYNRTNLEGKVFGSILAKEQLNEGVERLDNKVEVIEEESDETENEMEEDLTDEKEEVAE